MPQFLNRTTLLVSAVAFLLIPTLFAQTPQTQRRPGIPDGGTREVLVSIFIPSVPNLPFTATLNTEWVRLLGDGTRITLRNHRLIARNKSGGIFQERRLLIPESGQQQSVITQIEITDPISKEQYICVPSEHVCQVEAFHPPAAALSATGRAPLKSADSAEGVPLGTKLIAGVEAVGTLETRIIPQGAIGNSSPILTKMEYWYSRQLGFNALSIRDDPRFGTQKFEISDLVMGEPELGLFVPPVGSKILDLRSPMEIGTPVAPPVK